jgi:hypothetical protein
MDDDPEKRIAEMERRLAEPPRPVPGPPRYHDAREQPAPIPGPVPGYGGPVAPRVYVATVLDMRWGYLKVIGLIAALCGGPFVLAVLLHTTSGEVALWMHDVLLFAVIPLLLLVAFVTRSRRLSSFVSGRWPEVTIHVTPNALEVITGNGKRAVFPWPLQQWAPGRRSAHRRAQRYTCETTGTGSSSADRILAFR